MKAGFYRWKTLKKKSRSGGSTIIRRDRMGRWVIDRRLNLLRHKLQNDGKSLLIFVPKMGYTSYTGRL